MRKVVGVGFVVALMAAASPARAEPVAAAKFSGTRRVSGARSPRRPVRRERLGAIRGIIHLARRRQFRLGDDEDNKGFSSSLPAGWTTSNPWSRGQLRSLADRDWNAGLHLGWFIGRHHDGDNHVDARQLARFLTQMRERFKDHRSTGQPAEPHLAATPEPASLMLLGSGCARVARPEAEARSVGPNERASPAIWRAVSGGW